MHMRKRVIPFAYAQSIFEIEPVFYVRLGVKHLLVDLDNTLDPYTVDEPTERTKQWAQAIETAGIFAKAAVAEKAIPKCNVCFVTGEEMQTELSAFLEIMFEKAPQSVGGAVPGDNFYCILK